ncbi:NUDIX domain-containing protein [Radiobacillus deserti]|uniref:NUDIX hydrolase n=1 Tax=Radiobacillus deserti TaxID=2594883 RepID=A0A516KGL2_9BACI|nr:NUDIX hydrolase [Radiobacillus deserti]QDP40531.1 NUDIX hydrolase [Radiobacillus deserti]
MKRLEEKTIHTTPIFQGKIINVQVDEVELPDGKTSKREIVKHPGAVAIIAITKDQNIVMVEQFRKPLEKSIIEIPAGKLEPGEEPMTCAKRELEEETGYTSDHLEFITSFYTSPGFADEIIHIYAARNLSRLEVQKDLDEDEFVEVMECSLEEAEQLEKEHKIQDAKTAFAIQYVKAQGWMK